MFILFLILNEFSYGKKRKNIEFIGSDGISKCFYATRCIFLYKFQQRLPYIARACVEKYRKNSKNWDTLNYYRDCPTNGIVGFYSAILRSKDADRITNRVDTDQTAPSGAV